MNKIKTRHKQLAHYSLLAGSLLAITNMAEAQIIYTDIDPDEILNSGTFLDEEEYSLDLNADGIIDFNFRIAYQTWSYEAGPKDWIASVEPSGSNGIGYMISNFTSVSCYGAITTAQVILEMGEGDTISEDLNFMNDNAVVFWINEVTDPLCSTTRIFGVEMYGPAFYIPIRLSIDSSYHYGWIRYRVISATKTKVIDYAYEASIGVPIIAGKYFSLSEKLDVAFNVTATDINNYGDGRDLQVSFNRGADETHIQEYRLFLVQASMADSFDLADALSSIYFSPVPLTGADITTTLFESTRDITGAYITYNTPYHIFVLSYSETIPEVINTLSAPSNEIVLNQPVNIHDPDEAGIQIFSHSNYLHVQLNALNDKTSLSVTDNVGRRVFETQILQMENTFELSLSPGMYIATIEAGNKMYYQKIIITNE